MVKQTLKVGNAVAKPGEWAKGKIPVFEYCEGNVISLPVMVMNGAGDGPLLFLNANFHGPEIAGSEVIRRLIREEIDPKELNGGILACLCANPLALEHGHVYGNPRDDKHIQVPGRPDGSTSERIGNVLWTQFCEPLINHPEGGIAIDIHCTGASPPWAINICSFDASYGDEEVNKKCMKFAKAWGWTFHHHDPVPGIKTEPRGMRNSLMAKGVPCFGTELTDGRRMTGPQVDTAVIGIKNGMKAFGMIPGSIEKQKGIKIVEGDFTVESWMHSNRGGYLYLKEPAGEFLKKGTVVAVIKDVYGDVVEEVKVEKDCYIYTYNSFYFSTSDTIGTGDIIAYRFNKKV